METSNLIELPPDYSFGINSDLAKKGHSNLGHVSSNMVSPNMSLNRPRDLGYYRQTEAIFNVLRDNENMKFFSELSNIQNKNSSSNNLLKCHGHNSVKDYLSMTKAESTFDYNSSGPSPSCIRNRAINQESSNYISRIGF